MTLNLTVSPDFAPDRLSGWYIFNTWLARQLDTPVHLALYDDFAAQRAAIAADQVDIIYANPFDAAMLVREKGFVPLARPDGQCDEAVIAVEAASPWQCVEDLQPGIRIATTDDPHVHMMSMMMLESADLSQETVTFDACDSYVLVAKALLSGQAGAGFFLSAAFDGLSPVTRKRLRVLIRSQISVIEHVLLTGPGLGGQRQQLQSALLGMAQDTKGAGVLGSLGFDGWQPVEQEDTEFMIDLMETLAS